jgi:hypothetical protein
VLRSLALVSCALLSGCLNFRKVDDAKAPGDMLGVFQVQGDLKESSCGAGALGATDSWAFEVKLSRFENDLYWLNGQETIVGDIASDGRSFSIKSDVQVKVSDPGRGKPGCQVLRTDDAEGRLSDSGTDVESFKGTLGYAYAAVSGSDCSDWIGSPGAVTVLPCTITYSILGERSAEK